MSIKVENLNFSDEGDFVKSIHSIPCKVHFNGEANISSFFKPERSGDNIEELRVSFRGFPLNGVEIPLPHQYHGFILEEKIEAAPRNILNMNKFKSVTYWNWDKKPSKNDLLLSALDWLDLSQVHDPIEDEVID